MKDKYYYKDGSILNYRDDNKVLHKENGPAIEFSNGSKFWFKNNKFHRLDGPAIEWKDGTKCWYINDEKYTEEEYNRHIWILRYL